MRLYLLRHATAVPHGTPEFEHDADRPLTEEGREQARRAADALKRLKIAVDAVITSPFVRAVQTAEPVARAFGLEDTLSTIEALQPEADPAKASAALRGLAAFQHVVAVGHEPHMGAWLGWLTAPGGLRCEFKKGGMASVDIDRLPPARGDGTLRWFMTPKQLALIGKG
jgi:phosphohistidine phosphatase